MGYIASDCTWTKPSLDTQTSHHMWFDTFTVGEYVWLNIAKSCRSWIMKKAFSKLRFYITWIPDYFKLVESLYTREAVKESFVLWWQNEHKKRSALVFIGRVVESTSTKSPNKCPFIQIKQHMPFQKSYRCLWRCCSGCSTRKQHSIPFFVFLSLKW